MANIHRGEIDARLDGKVWRLCLTLGALAELEAAFGDSDMMALAERFEKGRLSAREAVRVIGAGLRGAGHAVSDDDVAAMTCERGAAGFVDIVARLLIATFGAAAPETTAPTPASSTASPPAERPEVRKPRAPFPGDA